MSGRHVTYLASVTEDELRAALAATNGNARQAAARLGVHPSTVYRLQRRYGISKPGEVVVGYLDPQAVDA